MSRLTTKQLRYVSGVLLAACLAGCCATPQKEVNRLTAEVERLKQDRAIAEARARHAWFVAEQCSQGRCPEGLE